MAIIFYQKDWEFINIIDSEEHSWYSMEQFQTEFVLTKWYRIVEDRFPHDWKRTESNGKSVSQNARDLWIPVRQLPIWRISDWINELKRIFHKIRIDEENAASLIKSLSNYRREWDKKRGMYMDKPFHNRASHLADAARYLAVSFKDEYREEMTNIQKKTKMMWNDKKIKRFNALTWFN